MARYQGVNDRSALLRSEPTCDVFIWKGEAKKGWGKTTTPGRDLKNRFRLEIGNKEYQTILLQAYRKRGHYIEEKTERIKYTNGSGNEVLKKQTFLYVDHLNIFCASEDDERTFSSDLVVVQGNKILQRCDRMTIYKESEEQTTWTGTRWGVKNCNKPCQAPQDDPFAPCPLKCEKEASFYFYLFEFDAAGVFPVCRIKTHSFEDIIRIPKALMRLEHEFGSIRKSPKVYQFKYKMNIPLILTRSEVPILRPQTKTEYEGSKKIYKRTGKKSYDTTWTLTLDVPADWVQAFYEDILIKEIEESGGRAAKALYQSVYGDAIDVDSIEITEALLSPAETLWSPTADDKTQMNLLYSQNNWNRTEFVKLTQRLFGITNPKDLNNLYKPQWEKLIEALSIPLLTAAK